MGEMKIRVFCNVLLSLWITFPLLSQSIDWSELTTTTVEPSTAVAARFVPVTPCRVVDTRTASGPLGGPRLASGATRSFVLPDGPCGLPASSAAYSLNVTVVPPGALPYLTIWPAGQSQPWVSTLNSFDGRVVANAALTPAGAGGAVSVYAAGATHVIIDVNGYFDSSGAGNEFYPVSPCRLVDTRAAPGVFGGPIMSSGSSRSFPLVSGPCSLPFTALAYSLNATVVPSEPLSYLTLWPTGQAQPFVSTLNSFTGGVVANAAVVPAGTGGAVSVYVTNRTEVVLDTNGYFAMPGSPGALKFFPVSPCRVVDTRLPAGAFGGPRMGADTSRDFAVTASGCGIPATARAYSLNVTAVPPGPLSYLSLYPAGQARPYVSTLNSFDGRVVANAAIVPAGAAGAISVYVTDATDVVLDINGYFAP